MLISPASESSQHHKSADARQQELLGDRNAAPSPIDAESFFEYSQNEVGRKCKQRCRQRTGQQQIVVILAQSPKDVDAQSAGTNSCCYGCNSYSDYSGNSNTCN